jgi:hypothetical protein
MGESPEIKDGLAVGRADLEHALRIIADTLSPQVRGICLSYDEPWLYLKTRTNLARASAKGIWPLTIIVPASWAKRLVRKLPAGDPIILHVDDGRLYINKFSVPCEWTAEEDVLDPQIVENTTAEYRLRRAAEILKPFCVEEDQLQRLLTEVRERGVPAWSETEQKMIAAVAKAWTILAPLGIETTDLQRLITDSVRNAWQSGREQ